MASGNCVKACMKRLAGLEMPFGVDVESRRTEVAAVLKACFSNGITEAATARIIESAEKGFPAPSAVSAAIRAVAELANRPIGRQDCPRCRGVGFYTVYGTSHEIGKATRLDMSAVREELVGGPRYVKAWHGKELDRDYHFAMEWGSKHGATIIEASERCGCRG